MQEITRVKSLHQNNQRKQQPTKLKAKALKTKVSPQSQKFHAKSLEHTSSISLSKPKPSLYTSTRPKDPQQQSPKAKVLKKQKSQSSLPAESQAESAKVSKKSFHVESQQKSKSRVLCRRSIKPLPKSSPDIALSKHRDLLKPYGFPYHPTRSRVVIGDLALFFRWLIVVGVVFPRRLKTMLQLVHMSDKGRGPRRLPQQIVDRPASFQDFIRPAIKFLPLGASSLVPSRSKVPNRGSHVESGGTYTEVVIMFPPFCCST